MCGGMSSKFTKTSDAPLVRLVGHFTNTRAKGPAHVFAQRLLESLEWCGPQRATSRAPLADAAPGAVPVAAPHACRAAHAGLQGALHARVPYTAQVSVRVPGQALLHAVPRPQRHCAVPDPCWGTRPAAARPCPVHPRQPCSLIPLPRIPVTLCPRLSASTRGAHGVERSDIRRTLPAYDADRVQCRPSTSE